jgi:hypothetical protein
VQWRPHAEVSDSNVSQELLWLSGGGISGTQEGKLQPWEAGTRRLEGQQIKRAQCVYSELQRGCRLCVYNSDRIWTVPV